MVELFSVVDENDNLIKGEERSIVHSSKQWHRDIGVFIFNSRGELLVQIRSLDKDKHPNKYDCSVSGHVEYGEEYEEAAVRETKEELGIDNVKIKPVLHCRMVAGPNDYQITKLFKCIYDGKIKPNEEVSEIRFFELEDLREIIDKEPDKLAPWFLEILKWYFKMDNKLHIFEVY
jgi:isopentenyl-diphosphate delta-isomerase